MLTVVVFCRYSFGQALVVVTGKKIVECFRAGEETLSFQEGVEDLLPVRHLTEISYDKIHQQVGPEFPMEKNPIIKALRNNFKSHQISIYHDRMIDAVERCLSKDLTFKPGENATEINASVVFQKMIARISSQVFAGEEYAENEALIDALANYALTMFRAGLVESVLPRPMADYLVRNYLPLGQNIGTTVDEVLPMVEELKEKEEREGRSQPTHFMHMMLQTPGADDHIQTPEEVAFWMKDIAFASIHTTSLFLGFALHDLSDRPDVQEILRKEVADARAKHGVLTPDITKDLPIMDSFFREVLRLGSDYVGFRHKAMKDFVLSDGTLLSKGSTVGLAVWDAHANPEIQDIGDNNVPLNQVDPYRFVGKRSKKSTSVGQDLLTFGVGHHACPGRFFASQEIRYLLACMIERYDIKATTTSGKRAKNLLALVSFLWHIGYEILLREVHHN
jgi:cytochrome P450